MSVRWEYLGERYAVWQPNFAVRVLPADDADRASEALTIERIVPTIQAEPIVDGGGILWPVETMTIEEFNRRFPRPAAPDKTDGT